MIFFFVIRHIVLLFVQLMVKQILVSPQSTRDQLNHDNMIFRNILLQLRLKDIPKRSSKSWENFDGSNWEQDSHGQWKPPFNNIFSLPSSSTPRVCVFLIMIIHTLQFTIQSGMGANRNVTNN